MGIATVRVVARCVAAAGWVALMTVQPPAFGQDATADSAAAGAVPPAGALQEVTVTATRREELQVEVPMSITAIGQQTLQVEEVKGFNDFATHVANLNFNYGGSPGGTGGQGGNTDDRAIAIRGIQGGDTVGFYLDDLPIPLSLNPRVVDMQRIEVLRGPQGTLYGARSMGGTVRLITNAPDPSHFSAFGLAQGTSIDGHGNGYEFYGIFNVPVITDTLAVRITPYRGQDGGYINRLWPNVGGPPSVPWSEQKNSAEAEYYGVDAQLLWKPIENLSIRPRAIYQSTSTNGLPLGDYSAQNLTNYRHFDIPEGILDRFWITGVTIDYATPVGTITEALDFMTRHTGDWEDVSEFTAFAFAPFGVPLLPSPIYQFTDTHTANNELRFASSWSFPLQLVAGLFYNRNTNSSGFFQPIVGSIPGINTGACAPDCTDQYAASYGESYTEARAVYGELTYKFTPQWSAVFGGRYSWERSVGVLNYGWGLLPGLTGPNPTLATASSVPNVYEKDQVFTPKFLLQYQPTTNLNVYADAAKGFRPGYGQNPPSPTLCAASYAQLGLTPDDFRNVKPDSVWSYELGGKALTEDHRYQINTALFWINWTDVRELLPLNCGFAGTTNSGLARSRGAEFEFTAAPINGLTVSGGIGYDDAKVIRAGTNIPFPAPGSWIQEVSPLTGNASADYRIPLGAPQLELRADYTYTGHRYSSTTSPTLPLLVPASAQVNLRAALIAGMTQFALFVQNVGDVHPSLSEAYSIAGYDPGRLRWATGVPRTYGVEVSQRF